MVKIAYKNYTIRHFPLDESIFFTIIIVEIGNLVIFAKLNRREGGIKNKS